MKDNLITKTEYYLNELSTLTLNLVTTEKIPVLDTLKNLKRTGKEIRLKKFADKLTVRSVYDHILSLSRFADQMVGALNNGDYDCDALARLIAYHEICEVLIGDIPQYSSVKMTDYEYLNDQRVNGISKTDREIYASNFIKIFASNDQRKSIDALVYAMENPDDKTAKFFEFLDTIDPIISVWRYLYFYRKDKDFALSIIETLTDYFVYPHTLTFKGDKDYPFAEEFIDNLCNKDNAKKYVLGKNLCECIDTPNYLGVLQTLIEKTPIIFE